MSATGLICDTLENDIRSCKRDGQALTSSDPRWENPGISYSFAPDGTEWDGGSSSLFAHLNSITSAATWQREFARALQTWAAYTPLNFYLVNDDGTSQLLDDEIQGSPHFGDIRLGDVPISPFYAASYFPIPWSRGGDITLNSEMAFSMEKQPGLFSFFLHHIGHSLGLPHSDQLPTIMARTLDKASFLLYPEDIAKIQTLYGVRQPDSLEGRNLNDTFSTASALSYSTNGVFEKELDITVRNDKDYFRLSFPSKATGKCAIKVFSGKISSLQPTVSIYDSTYKLIKQVKAPGYGQNASLGTLTLSKAAVYYVAVTAPNDEFGVGAYKLKIIHTLTGVSTPAMGD